MKKQFRTRMVMLILLVLLLIGLVSFAGAKYATTISYTGRITFSASLAEDVILQEHLAVRQPDGSYKLDETVAPVQANTYKLIPGLDIPKDPHIIIEGKTPIPAYLYIEVVDNTTNDALRYSLTDSWSASSALAPKHEGEVYVYSADDTNPAKITSDPDKIYILKDNKFYVDQALLSGTGTNGLTFYAYLVEATN